MQKNVAIVTGYSSGLGLELTRLLTKAGFTVVGVSRSSRIAEIDIEPKECIHEVNGSVFDESTCTRAFTIAKSLGELKVLINCAGSGAFGPIGTQGKDNISTVIDSNLSGLILFCEHMVGNFIDSESMIVNIMSTAAKKYRQNEALYTASKWGAKAYTRVLRDELKARKSNIKVIEVYPCGMHTPFWQSSKGSPTDGSSFPSASGIAEKILSAITAATDSYINEISFERT